MRPGYPEALTHQLSSWIGPLHLVRAAPSPTEVQVIAALGVAVLAVGFVLGSRLVAPVGPGTAAALAVGTALLAVGADALCFQLHPLAPPARPAIWLLTGGLMVELARRVLDVGPPRALGTLAVGGGFAVLIGALLVRAVQLANAI